jgi:hypothetical protein
MKHTRRTAALLAVLCFPVGVMAQVTGSGTTNRIAKWTGSTALGNSHIVENNGSACVAGVAVGPCVGIGTSQPAAHLHIVTPLNGRTTLLKVENTGPFSAAALELKAASSDNLNDWRITAQDTGADATAGLLVGNSNGSAIFVAPNLNVGNRSPVLLYDPDQPPNAAARRRPRHR